MKKTFILSAFIVCQLSFVITNAQSTTILPNRLSVPNVSSLSTCDNNTKGSTVFNTTDKKMYYCNGTNWQEMTGGGFSLPYIATQAAGNVAPLLHLTNTSQTGIGILGEAPMGIGVYGKSTGSYGVYGSSYDHHGVGGYSKNNIGVRGNSELGTGGYFESDEGNAIEIKGKMNINSTLGAGGAQLVVPSNGSNPIWQDPVAFSVNDLGTGNLSVASTADKKIPFTVKDFDLGNNFSLANSEFTAPVKGVYHFDAFALWNALTNGSNYVSLILKINTYNNSYFRVPAVAGKEITSNLSLDILLNAGDKVTIYAYQTTGVAQTMNPDTRMARFTGHLVYRQ